MGEVVSYSIQPKVFTLRPTIIYSSAWVVAHCSGSDS